MKEVDHSKTVRSEEHRIQAPPGKETTPKGDIIGGLKIGDNYYLVCDGDLEDQFSIKPCSKEEHTKTLVTFPSECTKSYDAHPDAKPLFVQVGLKPVDIDMYERADSGMTQPKISFHGKNAITGDAVSIPVSYRELHNLFFDPTDSNERDLADFDIFNTTKHQQILVILRSEENPTLIFFRPEETDYTPKQGFITFLTDLRQDMIANATPLQSRVNQTIEEAVTTGHLDFEDPEDTPAQKRQRRLLLELYKVKVLILAGEVRYEDDSRLVELVPFLQEDTKIKKIWDKIFGVKPKVLLQNKMFKALLTAENEALTLTSLKASGKEEQGSEQIKARDISDIVTIATGRRPDIGKTRIGAKTPASVITEIEYPRIHYKQNILYRTPLPVEAEKKPVKTKNRRPVCLPETDFPDVRSIRFENMSLEDLHGFIGDELLRVSSVYTGLDPRDLQPEHSDYHYYLLRRLHKACEAAKKKSRTESYLQRYHFVNDVVSNLYNRTSDIDAFGVRGVPFVHAISGSDFQNYGSKVIHSMFSWEKVTNVRKKVGDGATLDDIKGYVTGIDSYDVNETRDHFNELMSYCESARSARNWGDTKVLLVLDAFLKTQMIYPFYSQWHQVLDQFDTDPPKDQTIQHQFAKITGRLSEQLNKIIERESQVRAVNQDFWRTVDFRNRSDLFQ
ncbi:hypothetical protein A2Z22_03840 [Candidatus Woesebacteria bacterium RBG_16_34_12]|uniref:Uncharacterized protein n=1 Tax=Candidatus Woesebacteria bacterium RBG_16_34_12 TaxID=1802480 RepID=A0A1F7X7B2_9BACT|nr:MAG: hypothetical protein A2Z22_03840 [Candidatus Woesebacteria bacterium RBG_16_34_12]